ncbi:hypothetical protein HCN44_002082 [Aphidius gifuensis]|uniref:Uncharacterized protein n=1 Tax=Aphidius gifuensis TaxID=684658 RepID=A0A834XZE1_APHGI|nr:uncharacterized protein LOC122847432 [Aphidius gifuensis]KAF7996450.1 hypothetical protein HCN44_002082 [Aphidius gifuensis]
MENDYFECHPRHGRLHKSKSSGPKKLLKQQNVSHCECTSKNPRLKKVRSPLTCHKDRDCRINSNENSEEEKPSFLNSPGLSSIAEDQKNGKNINKKINKVMEDALIREPDGFINEKNISRHIGKSMTSTSTTSDQDDNSDESKNHHENHSDLSHLIKLRWKYLNQIQHDLKCLHDLEKYIESRITPSLIFQNNSRTSKIMNSTKGRPTTRHNRSNNFL